MLGELDICIYKYELPINNVEKHMTINTMHTQKEKIA